MKRRKTSSKYSVDEMGRIKKNEVTLSPKTESMLTMAMLAEAFNTASTLEGEVVNEGTEDDDDTNVVEEVECDGV